jgi:hypothetical protein
MKIFLKMTVLLLAVAIFAYGSILSSYAEDALTGKVIETMDSGGYTYAQIENNGKKTWVAVPASKVSKGQNISFAPGAEMLDFKSKTMNRTFDRIIFSSGIVEQSGKVNDTKTAVSKKGAEPSSEKIKVGKAAGPNSYTVAEIYKNGVKLENKKIVVKGKVVKIASGVMKKNWIHIQDGSGDAKAGNNDLVITSNDLSAVGDIVTASGTLHNNKDFGSGYKYSIIIEDASIKH